MVEAAKTTASAGEVWLICVIAVGCLAFWLSMVAWADKHPIHRGRELPDMNVPVLGGMHVTGASGRSVAPNREAPAVLTGAELAGAEQPGAEQPGTRPWAPRQRGAQAPAPGQAPEREPVQHGLSSEVAGMPAQRTSQADQPERSGAADRRPDET